MTKGTSVFMTDVSNFAIYTGSFILLGHMEFMKMSHGHVTFFFKANIILPEMMQFSYLMLKNMMNVC